MESMMYKPGDKVCVRKDLTVGNLYPMLSGRVKWETHYRVVDQMAAKAGCVFTIKEAESCGWGYRLCEYEFGWTDSMFELPNECICDSLL